MPQRLWSAFEPALDMLLTQIFWRDYELFQAQRQLGKFPELQGLQCVAPAAPLPVGLMTTCGRDHHLRLFRQAEEDARTTLHEELQSGEAP